MFVFTRVSVCRLWACWHRGLSLYNTAHCVSPVSHYFCASATCLISVPVISPLTVIFPVRTCFFQASQILHLCGVRDSDCISNINRKWYRKVQVKTLKETTTLSVAKQFCAGLSVQLKLTGEKLVPVFGPRTDAKP